MFGALFCFFLHITHLCGTGNATRNAMDSGLLLASLAMVYLCFVLHLLHLILHFR